MGPLCLLHTCSTVIPHTFVSRGSQKPPPWLRVLLVATTNNTQNVAVSLAESSQTSTPRVSELGLGIRQKLSLCKLKQL